MAQADLYPLVVQGERHSVLKLPSSLPEELCENAGVSPNNVFNILMADVSGSMSSFWPYLEKGWNDIVSPVLEGRGRNRLYAYGDFIELLRDNDTKLKREDFRSTGTEDLTNALKTVMKEINECKETYIRAFIVSDGAHCVPGEQPDTVIKTMKPPVGKVVEVYMLGVGYGFPVQYSIDIRSLLHNGPTNIPYIFWPKTNDDIAEQMTLMANEITGGNVQLNLSIPGSYLPGVDTTSTVYLDEWIYISQPPEELANLKVSLENGKELDIKVKDSIDYDLMTKKLFSQWNTVILQKHRKKEKFDHKVFDIMEEQFKLQLEKLQAVDLSAASKVAKRLHEKFLKRYQTDFATLMNESKSLIDTEEKYRNELDLAEVLVKTTTSGKYQLKSLKLKGHSSEDYEKDLKEFADSYEKIKDNIMSLDDPDPDDCCRITVTSTITDLQDSDFKELFKENKFEFLKTFTLTGIPILSVLKDSTELNPWTIHLKNILINPFEVLSQRALEFGADAGDLTDKDKSVVLKKEDESTRFNAVIPIFPKGTVDVLKPLLVSKLFAMCCTFSILKNVMIIDYECHIAALACAWLRTIHDYPKEKRPEFIRKRIEGIEETSKIYKGRKGLRNYTKCLIADPQTALMTESEDLFEESKIKCESLTKPTFLLHLYNDELNPSIDNKGEILKVVLSEFIGRCFSHNNSCTLYTNTFISDLNDKSKTEKWYENVTSNIIDSFDESGDDLIKQFYAPEQMKKSLVIRIRETLNKSMDDSFQSLKIEINLKKIESLRNSGSCGDVTWNMLRSWANEIGVDKDAVNEIFSVENITAYVYHALKCKTSKVRMSRALPSVEDAQTRIKAEVKKENLSEIKKFLIKKIPNMYEERWLAAYRTAHDLLVTPMNKESIIEAAKIQGVSVNKENFDTIYRFRPGVNLLRNACMSEKCPHFLQPHNNFNQHISIERQSSTFPHNLHLVTWNNCKKDIASIINLIHNEAAKRPRKKIKTTGDDERLNLELKLPELIQKYERLVVV